MNLFTVTVVLKEIDGDHTTKSPKPIDGAMQKSNNVYKFITFKCLNKLFKCNAP